MKKILLSLIAVCSLMMVTSVDARTGAQRAAAAAQQTAVAAVAADAGNCQPTNTLIDGTRENCAGVHGKVEALHTRFDNATAAKRAAGALADGRELDLNKKLTVMTTFAVEEIAKRSFKILKDYLVAELDDGAGVVGPLPAGAGDALPFGEEGSAERGAYDGRAGNIRVSFKVGTGGDAGNAHTLAGANPDLVLPHDHVRYTARFGEIRRNITDVATLMRLVKDFGEIKAKNLVLAPAYFAPAAAPHMPAGIYNAPNTDMVYDAQQVSVALQAGKDMMLALHLANYISPKDLGDEAIDEAKFAQAVKDNIWVVDILRLLDICRTSSIDITDKGVLGNRFFSLGRGGGVGNWSDAIDIAVGVENY